MQGTIKELINLRKSNLIFTSVVIAVMLAISYKSANAQDVLGYPEIGKACPDFMLSNIEFSNASTIKLGDLKGQHVILDFWSTGCVPCVKYWPIIDKIQRDFHGRLKVILVGREEKNRDIEKFYKHFKDKYDLNLTSAYDSTLVKRFVPNQIVPHIIWLDPSGIVKAVSTSEDGTRENIDLFLAGRDFPFTDKSFAGLRQKERAPNSAATEVGMNRGDTAKLFSSNLFRWRPNTVESSGFTISTDEGLPFGKFEATKLDLKSMYHLAYFGSINFISDNFYPQPILKCKDSTVFRMDYKGDGKELFNYIIQMRKGTATSEKVMKTMQLDLSSCFNYEVKIVNRPMPCLKLVVVDSMKVRKLFDKKIDGKTNSSQELKYKQWVNAPIEFFHTAFSENLPWPIKHFVYNETNLTGKISIRLKGDTGDLDNIRKELNKQGLDIKPSTRIFRVLEISDPDTSKKM